MLGWSFIRVTTHWEENGWYYSIDIGEFRRPCRGPYDTKAAAIIAGQEERARLERATL